MKINFDEWNERRNTNCGKWDTMDKKYQKEGMLHLGVADMDLRSPKQIIDAFQDILDKGIFGYTDLSDRFYENIREWMRQKHQAEVSREEIVFCPRINVSSSICVETFTEEMDEVIINTPAYGPLYQAVVKNHRKVVESPLILENGSYKIDFAHLESVVTDKTKMFILCSPHNPVGRVWTREELEEVGAFCKKHDLLLFVDEIHGDIVAEGVTFTTALTLSETVRERLIVATSLTKTFNVPGVIVSYMIVPDEEIRSRIAQTIDRIGMHNPTIFAVAAVEHGYMECEEWYRQMLAYVNENETFTREFFAEHFPEFEILERQGTYLLWISYEKLGITEEELEKWFLEKANVSVYMGSVFGNEGRGFIRLNIASPRAMLKEAYERMAAVYSEIK
ncbi:MAG: MalY/PatB family protein [Blautia caecimuris]